MGYLTREQLDSMGFQSLGTDVKISDRASIYDPSRVSIGDYSRIDDFCVVAGTVSIGRNVHIAVFSNLAGGRAGITMGDFSGLAYGCHLIAQSDDYSGQTMTNPTVPHQFKNETSHPVELGRHAILGAGTTVLPGVTIGEGTSTGAMTLVNRSLSEWSIYVGAPARRVKERSRDLLELETRLLEEESG